MLDKHGNKIEVGDTVEFQSCMKSIYKNGIVTETGKDSTVSYYIVDKWSNNSDNGIPYYFSNYVEIIKKAKHNMQEESEVFTAEDQEQLDKLLNKQMKFKQEEQKSYYNFENIVGNMYREARIGSLGQYVDSNIDEICAILQAYKKYHSK